MKAADERARDRSTAARLVGRTIVKAVPHAGWDSDRKALRNWIHSWQLHLDDGTVVSFLTEETDHGCDYGAEGHTTIEPDSSSRRARAGLFQNNNWTLSGRRTHTA
jgi:hypothetical protein